MNVKKELETKYGTTNSIYLMILKLIRLRLRQS